MIRLVVFDCDGTLVDSQYVIVEAMSRAFAAYHLDPPLPAAVRQIVGLSLVPAVAALLPPHASHLAEPVAAAYKAAFTTLREAEGQLEPLFPGIPELLDDLERLGMMLALATGKSRRGVDAVLGAHGLLARFVSIQTADTHPSKPHPAMLEAAMRETGSRPEETVLIGDTTFDVHMGGAAGARAVGVAWGYHPVRALLDAGAAGVAEDVAELLAMVRP